MFIGKVVGTVWATRKHPSLERSKMLLVSEVDGLTGKNGKPPILAVDRYLSAGIGDMVLIMDEGNSARQLLEDDQAPVRTIVVAIIDQVTQRGKTIKWH